MQTVVRIEGMDEVIRNFRGIADDQIPFATALSLTSTAKLAQAAVQEALPARFTIRRLTWAKQGVRVTAATKRELRAVVEDIHDYMELQEVGGDKTPRYGRFLCIPLSGARRSVGALVAEQDKPKAVMESGLGFIRGKVMYKSYFKRSQSRRGFKGVGGFSAGSWERKIVPMYALVERAKVPKRYGFEDVVRQLVGQQWESEFAKAFERAVATKNR